MPTALASVESSLTLPELPDKICGALELSMAVAIRKYRSTTPGAPPLSEGSKEERTIAAAKLAAGKQACLPSCLLIAIWYDGLID